ncbi:hypothetical protein MPSEU_000362700 [Mayamaea pseudoterrestris]|nr:hypothetical protein MPSEU_000362700 [Mayamaea pseudoterrestris]
MPSAVLPASPAAHGDETSNSGEEPLSVDKFPTDWDQTNEYPAISAPLNKVGDLRRQLTGFLLSRPKVKCIHPCPNDPANRRILVLDPFKQEYSKNGQPVLFQTMVEKITSNDSSLNLKRHLVHLSYKDYSVDEVLQKILPHEQQELPSAFEQIGPICHVNLRNELLKYKYWIGKVLLDKNYPSIRTVVVKLGNIETEFRTFAMEVVAGNDKPGWSIVTLKEEGCVFELDFQQVYWNSRLAGEHRRLVELLKNEAAAGAKTCQRPFVVADLMAGIGPFAVPLTATMGQKKQKPKDAASSAASTICVYANDLNPVSFHYLQVNATKNKCNNLHCFNLDARAMVHKLQDENIFVNHFVMNLPKIAPEFLDAFRGYQVKDDDDDKAPQPTIHVYCFAPKASQDALYPEALERCRQALGCHISMEQDVVSVRTVRNIAPTKNMICVSFVLPKAAGKLERIVLDKSASDGIHKSGELAIASEEKTRQADDEPDCKRCKVKDDEDM